MLIYIQYIQNLIQINSMLLCVTLLLSILLGVILDLIFDNPILPLFSISICLIFVIVCVSLSFGFNKMVSCNAITENKQIVMRPNEYMDTDTYTFIVDNKELTTIKTQETKYYNDKPSQPYIIVEKITYTAPYRFYMDKSSIDEVNRTTKYILKEVHY